MLRIALLGSVSTNVVAQYLRADRFKKLTDAGTVDGRIFLYVLWLLKKLLDRISDRETYFSGNHVASPGFFGKKNSAMSNKMCQFRSSFGSGNVRRHSKLKLIINI